MMSKEIFSFALITVLVTRAWLGILTGGRIDAPVVINGLRWHHFYTGLIIIALGFLIAKRQLPRSLFLGIGLGLVIDELLLPFYLYDYSALVYWSAPSVAVVSGGLFMLYFLTLKAEKNN